MSQQYNRFQEEKSLAKARRIVKNWFRFQKQSKEEVDKRAVRIRDHRKACSCYMCMNPRRSPWYKGKGKLTLQERKNIQDERD